MTLAFTTLTPVSRSDSSVNSTTLTERSLEFLKSQIRLTRMPPKPASFKLPDRVWRRNSALLTCLMEIERER